MNSMDFMSISDELLAKYVEGLTSEEENEWIMGAIVCGADLWLFRHIVASMKDS